MLFLEVTGHTWLVTELGFGIVLLLLFCFVYVMKALGWIMQRIERKPAQAKTVVAAQPVVAAAEASAEDEIAVATALYLYYGIHDEDSPRLTIHSHHSTWNEHTFGINNLDR